MKKQSPHTYNLVYVHGTNGSGKSTLARALIAAAGGITEVRQDRKFKKAHTTHTTADVVFLGKYGTACGGVDGLSPYAAIHELLLMEAIFGFPRSVFAEGLITPGLETCQKMNEYAHGNARFVFLAPPVDMCIKNVLKRRNRKGTDKPYDPANLHKKWASAASWANRLSKAGLEVSVITSWNEAYLYCLAELGLPLPDITLLT